MKPGDIREARNPDLVGAVAAVQRAAQEARQMAIRSETGIVIERDGVMTHVSADELRHRQPKDSPV